MKKIFFLIFSFPLLTFGQRIQYDKFDEFTDERSVTTTRVSLSSHKTLEVIAVALATKKMDTIFLIAFSFQPSITTSIKQGSKILLKFQNSEVMEITNNGKYDIGLPRDVLTVSSLLSKQQMLQIIPKKISMIRIETSDTNEDYIVDESASAYPGEMLRMIKERIRQIPLLKE